MTNNGNEDDHEQPKREQPKRRRRKHQDLPILEQFVEEAVNVEHNGIVVVFSDAIFYTF